MKKYLREIQLSGMILMLIGVVMYRFMNVHEGYLICGIGILLWVAEVVYKAFHAEEYSQDNRKNILMMLIIIALLLGTMFVARCQ